MVDFQGTVIEDVNVQKNQKEELRLSCSADYPIKWILPDNKVIVIIQVHNLFYFIAVVVLFDHIKKIRRKTYSGN